MCVSSGRYNLKRRRSASRHILMRKMQNSTDRPIQLTALIEPAEEGGFVARCVELDVASEGETVEDARRNLIEAVELFFETAPTEEVRRRLKLGTFVTPFVPTLPASLQGLYA